LHNDLSDLRSEKLQFGLDAILQLIELGFAVPLPRLLTLSLCCLSPFKRKRVVSEPLALVLHDDADDL
jgi:hypothetical protein